MPEVHSKLSPSSADRWFVCPGSQVLSIGMPSKSSEFAEEGTKAHSMAEALLRGHAAPGRDDMRSSVQVYVDHVLELASSQGAKLHIEKQVHVTKHCWGTADAIVWEPTSSTLYVVDLKYGAGVGVEVRGNLQLKIYALAALLTMKYPAKLVCVGIAQPRFHHPDGPVRSVEFDAVDLIEFHADLLEAEQRVARAEVNADLYLKFRGTKPDVAEEWESKYLTPTEKGCRWCLAAPQCPKLKAKAQDMAKQVFAVATTSNGVRSYDPNELACALDFLPILEGWIKNVREFAYAEAEKGHAIPNYKLVEKRATRKWKGDEETIAGILEKEGVDPYEKKIISPAVAEKALGKANASILEALTMKESSGHALAHESDKRPAVKLDAKSIFTIEG